MDQLTYRFSQLFDLVGHGAGRLWNWFLQLHPIVGVALLIFSTIFCGWIIYRVFVAYPRSRADKALETPVKPNPNKPYKWN